jgi:hypothetical protein
MRTRLRELAAVRRRFDIGEKLAPAVSATLRLMVAAVLYWFTASHARRNIRHQLQLLSPSPS